MIKIRKAKIAALAVGMTLALGGAASTASAQTVAELQAMINQLMAQLAALQGGSSSSMTFTQNLTLGSTGSEVSALQQVLVSGGHLVMPAGVAYGYFGPLTQAAVAKWQAANGVSPAAGYWGPISRARYAALAGPSMPGGPSAPGAGITTPGVEGTLTATLSPTPVNGVKVYEGDSKVSVLGLKLEAKTSDIRVERVKVQLPSTTFYNRVASRIYVMDGSTVVGSADMNSNTVVREGSDYFITISGMNVVIPKNSEKVLSIALDINSSVDSTYRISYTLTIPTSGVRGTDGAGINQYTPSASAISRSHSVESELALDATLKVSLNANSPKANEVMATSGSDSDELDGLELLRFDVRAEKDNVEIQDLAAVVSWSGSTATTSTLYLYDGSTLIGSESANVGNGGTVTFDDIDYVVPKDTTRTLTIKTDVRDATASATNLSVTVNSGASIVAENSRGDLLGTSAKTGSATGRTISVRNTGIGVTLLSRNITTSGVPQSSTANNFSTSTLTATFNVRITAAGDDIALGNVASDTPLFSKTGATNSFKLYKDGIASPSNVATSTDFTIPTSCVTFGTNSCLLSDGSSVDVQVTFVIPGRAPDQAALGAGIYSVGLERLNWGNGQSTTFMAGDVDWRTSSVSFP